MKDIDDGVITGIIMQHRRLCGHCAMATTCVQILSLDLPDPLEPAARMIFYKSVYTSGGDSVLVGPVDQVGIGCGCYAKGHRQIAYMKSSLTVAK